MPVIVIRGGENKFWLFPLVSVDKRKNNGKKSSGNRLKTENSSIPSSGMYCPHCHEMVGNGNPDRENIYDGKGKEVGRKHYSCPKGLAVARSENTGLRETVNS